MTRVGKEREKEINVVWMGREVKRVARHGMMGNQGTKALHHVTLQCLKASDEIFCG